MKNKSVLRRDSLHARLNRATKHGDVLWSLLIGAMALLTLAVVIAIAWMLWTQSADARTKIGWGFFLPTLNATWNPALDIYQAWPFIYGTLITSLVAIVLAVPISIGIAVFLAELCPARLRLPLNWMIEMLAAIPSVVYGLWGIFIFLPAVVTPLGKLLSHLSILPGFAGTLFTGPISPDGTSRLAAGLVLTIMVIPTITAISRDVLLAIPESQREASMGLGATRWETIWQVLMPYGLSGMLGAVILGLGRVLGETMAVTMVMGNANEATGSLLKAGYTISSLLALQFKEAVTPLHTDAMIELGLTLFAITLILNIFARLLVWQVARRGPQEAHA